MSKAYVDTPQEAMERKKFEEWYENDAMPLESYWFAREDDGDWYRLDSVQWAWDGWKARAGIVSA